SLSYLNKFPLDVLKIDKSFVSQLSSDKTSMAITQSIVAIAHALDLEIVAEGVETDEQLSLLGKMGCQYVQGYLYGPPISAEESFNYLEKSNLFEHC
ncbi:MAG: EAL domain-containing protein, partial [Paraglaciecola sp.]